MRMHSHGKCTPNIFLGALAVFCMFVLYNYWTVSTLNQDLAKNIRSLEERLITESKANEALQASLDKMQEIKDKVEENLKREKLVDQKAKEDISHKDTKIKSLQNDIENSKQEAQNCREDFAKMEINLQKKDTNLQEKDTEVIRLKSKVVSLEAQLVEKTNNLSSLQKEIQEVKQKLSGVSSSTAKSSGLKGGSAGPVPAPEVEVAQHDVQPVLLSDPAAPPFPSGWMKPFGSTNRVNNVKIDPEGDAGVARTNEMGPVIIFDPPNMPIHKARFSVLDPPKNEMKPGPLKQPERAKHNNNVEEEQFANGGEDIGQQQVLPVPARRGDQPQHAEQNLDAAEDDGDRPLRDDFGQQDDQSPDGALSNKEFVHAALQPPDMKHEDQQEPDHRHQIL